MFIFTETYIYNNSSENSANYVTEIIVSKHTDDAAVVYRNAIPKKEHNANANSQ
jgi:hypothetical protein